MRPKLSVIIITKNEEAIIQDCLLSVHGWADEILILDSGSNDNTVEICRKFADRVIETDWPGYGKQKIKATEMASFDWILSIDADEVVSDELKDTINRELEPLATAGYTGFKIAFRLNYFGKMIRSLVKRKPLVLFNRRNGGFLDLPVHEVVKLDNGKVKGLHGYIYHYGSDSLYDQNIKLNRYAKLWADDKFKQGKNASLMKALLHSASMFIKTYLVYGGFLNGWRGALLSLMYTNYTFNKYTQLMMLNRLRTDGKGKSS